MRSSLHVSLVRALAPVLSIALALLATSWGGCDEVDSLAGTQVTARIYFAREVRDALSALRVRSYRGTSDAFTLRSDLRYPKAKLDDVMDVRFTPGADDDQGTILVVADAVSGAGKVLVEARATFVFVKGEQRLFELWLYRCGDAALGTLCAEPECADQTCLTCVRDRCAATPLFSKPQLTSFDPSLAADPDKLPPGHRAPERVEEPGEDAGAAEDSDAESAPEMNDGGPAGEEVCTRCDAGASEDTGQLDAGLAAGDDAAQRDADVQDAALNDASDARAADAGSDAQEPPGRCSQAANWTSARANAPIPAQARVLAEHSNASGALPQYLCRMRAPDGVVLAPGKVSTLASSPGSFDHGCYATYYGPTPGRPGSQSWQSFSSEAQNTDFQVLTPASECQLDWVAGRTGALPARALAVGSTGGSNPQPIYACRITVTDANTSGTHIGRVGSGASDTCHVQYYAQPPIERSQFEVLVQTAP